MRRLLSHRLTTEQWAWMLYDFANTSFTVIIVTFVYAVYFRQVVVGAHSNVGDLLWGVSGACSMIIVAGLAPLLGATADVTASRKRWLLFFAGLCVLCTALLGLVGPGMLLIGMGLFILANVAFEAGNVFYNAFLLQIAPENFLHTLSGYGWALGYAGAVVIVLVVRPLVAGGLEPANLPSIRASFVLAAVFFAIFTVPLIIWVREPPADTQAMGQARLDAVAAGYARLRKTFRELRRHRSVARFLLAYLCYNDGITTVVFFSTIYAMHTLGMSMRQLTVFYLAVQTAGIVGAVCFGWIGDWLGGKRTLTITLVLWVAVVGAASITYSVSWFYVVGLLAGLAIGSSQSTSRAMMATLTPKSQRAEFFGFYGVSGRLSSAFGPLLFGALSSWSGSQRLAILSVLVFFIAGLVLLQGVKDASSDGSGAAP